MSGVHLDALNCSGLRINDLPGVAIVFAAPEDGGLHVDDVFVVGIEDEEFGYTAQVEHAPGLAAVVGDVGAGHVTGDEDGVGIEGTDDWTKHGAAPARADDAEVSGALGECGGNKGKR